MKMVTTCPACGTSFRIHREQIDARGGQVRCGQCAVVFDANMYLELEAEHPPPTPIEDSSPVDEVQDAIVSVDAAEPEEEEAVASVEGSEPVLLEEFGFKPAPPRSRLRRALGGITAFFLALLFLGQLAFHFRTELTAALPALQPWLQAGCEKIGCVVPLPQRADLISIESDDMQFDSAQAELLTLSAIVRNRAAFDQAYPVIELTLTDDAQATVSRRLLQPAEYLSDALRHSPAFAANSEIAFKLHIRAEGLKAAGYRMEVLYL